MNVLNALQYIVFTIFSCLFHSVQSLIWVFNGARAKIRKHQQGEDYETSAQVWNIRWRYKLELPVLSDIRDFLCTFDRFVHPDYILKHNVTLYSIGKSEVTFIETNPDVDIYKPDANPFFYVAQFKNAIKVITMNLNSWHRIADEIGETRQKVVFLSNTGRCGSTLLGQMFQSVPNVVCLSEPDSLLCLLALKHCFKTVDYERAIRSMIISLTKPMSFTPRLIVIKTRSQVEMQVEDIGNQFPQIVKLFLYRDSFKTIQSFSRWYEVFHVFLTSIRLYSVPILKPLLLIHYQLPNWTRLHLGPTFCHECLATKFPWLADDGVFRNYTPFRILAIHQAVALALYVDYLERGVDVTGIRYEDLCGNTISTCKKLFALCGIDEKYIPGACACLKVDSQRGSTLGKALLNNKELFSLTNDLKQEADVIFKRLNLPSLDEETLLPNTLGHM